MRGDVVVVDKIIIEERRRVVVVLRAVVVVRLRLWVRRCSTEMFCVWHDVVVVRVVVGVVERKGLVMNPFVEQAGFCLRLEVGPEGGLGAAERVIIWRII